jgi:hypothetical protein
MHFRNPRVGALYNKWRQVWLSAMERQRRLQEALDYLNEVNMILLAKLISLFNFFFACLVSSLVLKTILKLIFL